MVFSVRNVALVALFTVIAGVAIDISAAKAAQVPGEDSLFYRRYRGEDEVDDERRGRGQGGRDERPDSSGDSGQGEGGGGKSSSGGTASGHPKSGPPPSPGKNTDSSDDNDRFGQ